MKKILYLIVIAVFATMSACGLKESNENSVLTATNDSIAEIDSLLQVLENIENQKAKGALFHLESYEIGSIYTITIEVNKIQIGNDTLSYINFSTDCGGLYYSSRENSILLKQEVKHLLEAIDQIRDKSKGETDHFQSYVYITRDNIGFSSYGSSSDWTLWFDVDINKSHTSILLNENKVDDLINLIKAAEAKIKEIE